MLVARKPRPSTASSISRLSTGGTDLMVYRKDLLEKAGIKPPKTLDEFIVAVQKLNDPDHGVYGIALRGLRGSGANVWRWMPYFRGSRRPVVRGQQAGLQLGCIR